MRNTRSRATCSRSPSRELSDQKDRLDAYEVQARFALATMYDKAANADASKSARRRPPQRCAGRAARRARRAKLHGTGKRRAGAAGGRLPCGRRERCRVRRGHSQNAQTIGDLVSKAPVVVQKNTPASADSAKAMENYKRFLELQRTDPKLRAEALRRLGDLNQESDQLDTLDKDLSQVDLNSTEAIRLYTLLLKAYPDYARNDQVLYQMARAYEATSKPDQALATLDQLIARYPAPTSR